MAAGAERVERSGVLFNDALAGADGTAEPVGARLESTTFEDPLADPRPDSGSPSSSSSSSSPRPAVRRPPPTMQFAAPSVPAPPYGVRPTNRMPPPAAVPPGGYRPVPSGGYRPMPVAARPAGYQGATPAPHLPQRGGPYPGPRPPGGQSDAAAMMQALRARARQRTGPSSTSSAGKMASGIWGLFVVLAIIGFSSGLVQRLISAISELLHHR